MSCNYSIIFSELGLLIIFTVIFVSLFEFTGALLSISRCDIK